MTFEEFQDTIELAYEQIPKQFRDILEEKNIAIIALEKTPEPMAERHRGLNILGAFIGTHYGDFVLANLSTDPTRIELYKEGFDKSFKNDDDIKAQIGKTLVHEIAHFLGFKEEEIRALDY